MAKTRLCEYRLQDTDYQKDTSEGIGFFPVLGLKDRADLESVEEFNKEGKPICSEPEMVKVRGANGSDRYQDAQVVGKPGAKRITPFDTKVESQEVAEKINVRSEKIRHRK